MSVYMLDKFQSGKIAGLKGLGFFGLILFWLLPWHAEGPGPGIEPKPQQWPKLLQWQHQILNWLCHKGTPKGLCLHGPCPQRPCVGLPSPPCFTSPNCEGGTGLHWAREQEVVGEPGPPRWPTIWWGLFFKCSTWSTGFRCPRCGHAITSLSVVTSPEQACPPPSSAQDHASKRII